MLSKYSEIMITPLLKMLMLILMILLSVAFLTLMERKLLSIIGFRLGPNKNSMQGLTQPLLDALKISNKQTNNTMNLTFYFYYVSTAIMIFSSLLMWTIMNLEPKIIDFKLSGLMIMFFLNIHTISLLFAGWSTSNKYSIISTMRMISQMISYEIVMFLTIFMILSLYTNYCLYFWKMKTMMFMIMPLMMILWLFSILAELSRTPTDFGESESELVSGFNLDFGSKMFSIIFLSEYSNILMMSFLTCMMFLNNYLNMMWTMLIYFFIIWIRAVLPRFRYDEFMMMCWKFLLPFSTIYFTIYLTMI